MIFFFKLDQIFTSLTMSRLDSLNQLGYIRSTFIQFNLNPGIAKGLTQHVFKYYFIEASTIFYNPPLCLFLCFFFHKFDSISFIHMFVFLLSYD